MRNIVVYMYSTYMSYTNTTYLLIGVTQDANWQYSCCIIRFGIDLYSHSHSNRKFKKKKW